MSTNNRIPLTENQIKSMISGNPFVVVEYKGEVAELSWIYIDNNLPYGYGLQITIKSGELLNVSFNDVGSADNMQY